MDILEALAGEAPPQSAGKCKLGRWLDEEVADDPNRDALVRALMERNRKVRGYLPIPKIGRVIRRLGRDAFDVSDRTVSEHRRRSCRCFD